MAVAANTPQDSMHLRIKRKGTTVFLLCYPEQLVAEVKKKIAVMFNREEGTFRLMYKDVVLDDTATIRAQQIAANDIVHLIFKMDSGDQYESVPFDDLDRQHEEYMAKTRDAA
mmetsp:Transcript_88278/g.248576  ORF Transcript_88278/g.248576 Transcript_88278/m.248576 type:complete len:113 (-) Transcript_88278:231-569(-)